MFARKAFHENFRRLTEKFGEDKMFYLKEMKTPADQIRGALRLTVVARKGAEGVRYVRDELKVGLEQL